MSRSLILTSTVLVLVLSAHASNADQPVDGDSYPAPSLEPVVTVSGGTPQQRLRLEEAVGRFTQAGLALPDLKVVFGASIDQCREAIGYFSPDSRPWQISICNEHITSVYLHELAHAWTRSHLTDEIRRAFMELRGLGSWNGKDTKWGERGMEVAANVIQAGLDDPGSDVPRMEERLLGFELLTGIEPPRLGLRDSDRASPGERAIGSSTTRHCFEERERRCRLAE